MGSKFQDGTSYKEMFLQDYSKLFSTKVNPSCPKCIKNYLDKYKSKIYDMESNCDYRLHKKYNGIQLGHGSNVILSNNSLTNELAEQLIEKHKAIHDKKDSNFKIEVIFDKYPKDWDKSKKNEKAKATPKKAKRKTSKKGE